METGHVVRFASQKHPFRIDTTPCLDLDCSCSIMGLTLTEWAPPQSEPRDCLKFTLRVCLKTWIEHDPPPRSLEVESLVREFLARFPTDRIHELGQSFQQARTIHRRLTTRTLPDSPDKVVAYSSVVDDEDEVGAGVCQHGFFFVFEGREFVIEDHYCANPDCDCQQVHVEFWERVPVFSPQRGIKIEQRLMATFTLAGKLKEIRFSEETDATTKYLLLAWQRRCNEQLREFGRRYDVMKVIGARSFPSQPKVTAIVDTPSVKGEARPKRRIVSTASSRQARRNGPCPCGSGLKFKRCCARRSAVAD